METCERCGGPLVAISITVSDTERTLLSCSRCDHRTWRAGGAPIDLGVVLADLSDDAARRAEAMRR